MRLRDTLQEFRELGIRRSLFRISWEARLRTRLFEHFPQRRIDPRALTSIELAPLPFASPDRVRDRILPSLSEAARATLRQRALDAARGHITAFLRWEADYGDPIQWHREPATGERAAGGRSIVWRSGVHWSRALRGVDADVKNVWEIARFNHAALLARAATFFPELMQGSGAALDRQIASFVEHNPYPDGVHWYSGLELAIRMMNLLFAAHVFGGLLDRDRLRFLILQSAEHIDEFFAFSQHSAYNDHLIGEAVGLLAAAVAYPAYHKSAKWYERALATLTGECSAQFFPDGGYFAQSHNYHRSVLQMYAVAIALAGDDAPRQWRDTLRRSAEFLHQQQNPVDGRLPNFGSNDGGIPLHLTSCDFADYRPIIQTSAIAGGLAPAYAHGPWDEERSWLITDRARPTAVRNAPQIDHAPPTPLRYSSRHSISFPDSGIHILRDASNEANFATFRCGDVTERFTQIDMLHLDVWIDGKNVLADPGTYRYNAATAWMQHFVRTAAHNTVTIDGIDQMLHYRQFKMMYWTKAKLRRFEDSHRYAFASGEHYGYRRTTGCTHRRCVLFLKPRTWVVVDTITGEGTHTSRLHWLCGAAVPQRSKNEIDLGGGSSLQLFRADGSPLTADVVAGSENPIRGWLSRYYGEKQPVTSVAASISGKVPQTFVSLIGAASHATNEAGRWSVSGERARAEIEITQNGIERFAIHP